MPKIWKEKQSGYLKDVNFMKKRCFISVVVGVRNRDEYLRHCLCSLLDQSLSRKNYEIIVVNYGGEKSTLDLVNSFNSASIKYIYTNEKGMWNESRAKNVGIRHAEGKIVCTTNADVLFPYNTLSYLIKKHKKDSKLILQLQRRDIQEDFKWESFLYPKNKLSELFKSKYEGDIKPRIKGFAGECTSVRKKELIKVKGYNEIIQGWGAADWEIFGRLEENGLKKLFVKRIGVFHQNHPNNLKVRLSKFEEYRQKTINTWKRTENWGVVKNESFSYGSGWINWLRNSFFFSRKRR